MGIFKKRNTIKLPDGKLKEIIEKCNRYGLDTFVMFASNNCEYCSPYAIMPNGKRRIYSISGKDKRYSPMTSIPLELAVSKCPKCNKFLSYGIYDKKVHNF